MKKFVFATLWFLAALLWAEVLVVEVFPIVRFTLGMLVWPTLALVAIACRLKVADWENNLLFGIPAILGIFSGAVVGCIRTGGYGLKFVGALPSGFLVACFAVWVLKYCRQDKKEIW